MCSMCTGKRIVFFFNDTATTEIYTLPLHDALPILRAADERRGARPVRMKRRRLVRVPASSANLRSEEHTSELQSRQYLVCRLLLEKKKIPSPPFYPLSFLSYPSLLCSPPPSPSLPV